MNRSEGAFPDHAHTRIFITPTPFSGQALVCFLCDLPCIVNRLPAVLGRREEVDLVELVNKQI